MKRTFKLISLLVVFAIALSCFAMQGLVAFAETNVWDGSTVTKPAGSGSQSDPYLIGNGAELAWMVMSYGGGNHFSFVDDIYLNDVDKINWETGEAEDGYTINHWYNRTQAHSKFEGHINGNGHVIYGLYSNDQTVYAEGSGGFGLLPVGGDLTINGLGIDKAYFEAYTMYSLGTFIGYGQGTLKGSMENCYTGADVTVKGKDAGALVGGGDIAAMFTIKNCYSLASISYTRRGGLVSDSWTKEYSFENVYCLGTALSNSVAASNNCYSTISGTGLTQVAEGKMQGSVFEGNALVLGDAFMATETYPMLKVFADEVPAFSGLAEPFTKGDGSSTSPYEVSTLGQLAHAVGRGAGKHYKLVNDIYINDVTKIDWSTGELLDESYTPVEWFSGVDKASEYYIGFNTDPMKWNGTFDGNGYTVHGLWYPNDFSKTTVGLFPGTTSATVKNFTLSNSYVVGGRFVGAVSSTFAGTAEKIVVDDTVKVVAKRNVTVDSYSCSGLFGYTNGITLKDCAFYGTLDGTSHIHGLVGTSWGTKVHASNSFSFGYQPFTTSLPAKNYNTKAEADANQEAYFSGLYQVKDVYTDTHTSNNNVTYKYDSDGVDTDGDEKATLEYDQSVSYSLFSFTDLISSQMKGLSAMENMPGLNADFFYATLSFPRTRAWARANGDADLDGTEAMAGDFAAIRNAIISNSASAVTDFNGDGTTDVCDLVAVWNYVPLRFSGDFTYTLAHWNAEGYVIVYANGDAEGKRAAESLKALLAEKGIELEVCADTAPETAKEILIGNTNRGLSETVTEDGLYKIAVNGDKIEFISSNSTYLNTAVKTFATLSLEGFAAETEGYHEYEGGSVTLNTALTNWIYKDKAPKTFTYVWGDEFYGTNLNKNKWVCSTGTSKMSGYKDVKLLDDERAVAVNGGSLKMTAQTFTDPSNPDIKYAVPASVHTQGTMEYRYGYVEIRAKVPYRTGVWPSFWMQSAATLGGRQNYDYFTEIDMFEVFGHKSDLYCNVHKWYSNTSNMATTHGITHIAAAEDGGISGFLDDLFGTPMGEEKRVVSDPENWHTYGFAWTPEKMCMYVDQTLFRVYDITSATKTFGSSNGGKDRDMSGFQDPLYIIFNNHVFTENYSYQPNLITGNEQNLPATYEVDYVRLYQGTETNTQLWTKQ